MKKKDDRERARVGTITTPLLAKERKAGWVRLLQGLEIEE